MLVKAGVGVVVCEDDAASLLEGFALTGAGGGGGDVRDSFVFLFF